MSRYGYLEVFQRVPWNSRYRESTVVDLWLYFIRNTTFVTSCLSFDIPYLLEIMQTPSLKKGETVYAKKPRLKVYLFP